VLRQASRLRAASEPHSVEISFLFAFVSRAAAGVSPSPIDNIQRRTNRERDRARSKRTGGETPAEEK